MLNVLAIILLVLPLSTSLFESTNTLFRQEIGDFKRNNKDIQTRITETEELLRLSKKKLSSSPSDNLRKQVGELKATLTALNRVHSLFDKVDDSVQTETQFDEVFGIKKTDEEKCPHDLGYTYKKDLRLCFKVFKMSRKRDYASFLCRKDGGYLISLDSEAKLEFFIRYLTSLGSEVYTKYGKWFQVTTGLLREKGGTFMWPNNSTYLPRWAPNEPSKSSTRDCGQVVAAGNSESVCEFVKQPFLCEILLTK